MQFIVVGSRPARPAVGQAYALVVNIKNNLPEQMIGGAITVSDAATGRRQYQAPLSLKANEYATFRALQMPAASQPGTVRHVLRVHPANLNAPASDPLWLSQVVAVDVAATPQAEPQPEVPWYGPDGLKILKVLPVPVQPVSGKEFRIDITVANATRLAMPQAELRLLDDTNGTLLSRYPIPLLAEQQTTVGIHLSGLGADGNPLRGRARWMVQVHPNPAQPSRETLNTESLWKRNVLHLDVIPQSAVPLPPAPSPPVLAPSLPGTTPPTAVSPIPTPVPVPSPGLGTGTASAAGPVQIIGARLLYQDERPAVVGGNYIVGVSVKNNLPKPVKILEIGITDEASGRDHGKADFVLKANETRELSLSPLPAVKPGPLRHLIRMRTDATPDPAVLSHALDVNVLPSAQPLQAIRQILIENISVSPATPRAGEPYVLSATLREARGYELPAGQWRIAGPELGNGIASQIALKPKEAKRVEKALAAVNPGAHTLVITTEPGEAKVPELVTQRPGTKPGEVVSISYSWNPGIAVPERAVFSFAVNPKPPPVVVPPAPPGPPAIKCDPPGVVKDGKCVVPESKCKSPEAEYEGVCEKDALAYPPAYERAGCSDGRTFTIQTARGGPCESQQKVVEKYFAGCYTGLGVYNSRLLIDQITTYFQCLADNSSGKAKTEYLRRKDEHVAANKSCRTGASSGQKFSVKGECYEFASCGALGGGGSVSSSKPRTCTCSGGLVANSYGLCVHAPPPAPPQPPKPPSGGGGSSGGGTAGGGTTGGGTTGGASNEALAFCYQTKSKSWICDGKTQKLLIGEDTEAKGLGLVGCKTPRRLNNGREITLKSKYSSNSGTAYTGFIYACGVTIDPKADSGSLTWNRDIRRFYDGIIW